MAGSSPIVDKDDGRCLPMKLTIHLTTEEARTIHDTTERNTTESPTQEGFGDSGLQVLQLAGSREPRITKRVKESLKIYGASEWVTYMYNPRQISFSMKWNQIQDV